LSGKLWPKVSVIWLNYNSIHAIDIAFKSLEAVANLNYPNFELIIVDNGSTDGSAQIIEKIVYEKLRSKMNVKFVRLKRNLGFTGGNNIGYRLKDPDSKYIMLTHNDVIPYPKSLRLLVEF